MKFYLDDESEIKEATIKLSLKYDKTLWDKQAGSSIVEIGNMPIQCSIGHVEDGGAEVSDKIVKLSNVYAKDGMRITSGTLWESQTKNMTRVMNLMIYSGASTGFGSYYKEGEIEIQLPYYELNGKKYYLEYVGEDENIVEYSDVFKKNGSSIKEYDRENGILTMSIDNMYYYTAYKVIATTLKLPKIDTDATSLVFSKGTMKIRGKSINGNYYDLLNAYISNITYLTESKENVYFTGVTNRNVAKDLTREAVSFFGGFYIQNGGIGDSEEKTIKFTFPEELLITTVDLPSDLDTQTLNIRYTLRDEQGNDVYFNSSTGAIVSSGTGGATTTWTVDVPNNTYGRPIMDDTNTKFERSMFKIDAHKKYYIKSIEYDLTSITCMAQLYAIWSEGNPGGTGNYYGYLRNDVEVGMRYTSTCTITSKSSPTIPVLTNNRTTTISSDDCVSLGFWNAKFSQNTINAGDIVNLTGKFTVNGYPYGNNFRANDVRLALILDKNVTFSKEDIVLSSKIGSVQVEELTMQETPDGKNLWIIDVDDEFSMGFLNESLKAMPDGDYIEFNIPLITDAGMSYTVLEMKTVLLGTGIGQTHTGGSNGIADTFDLNMNGATNDIICYVGPSDTTTCTIWENKKRIMVTDTVYRTDSDEGDGKNVSLTSDSRNVKYSLKIEERNNDVQTKSFEYYVAIPKKNSVRDNYLITGSEDEGFDMKMIEEPVISGDDYFELYYSTEENLDFNTAKSMSAGKWYTKEELLQDNEWQDVTMIKVVKVDDENIMGAFQTTVDVIMRTDSSDYDIVTDQKNKWKSRGYYKILDGDSTLGGYCGTSGVLTIATFDQPVGDEDVADLYNRQGDDMAYYDLTVSEIDDTPDTGDNSNLNMWIMLLIGTCALLGIMYWKKDKFITV